jgi:hypothetical protein
MPCKVFRNIISLYGEELLAPRLKPKLEDRPFSTDRNCLSTILAGTLHILTPFRHPKTEAAPWRFDKDPLIMHNSLHYKNNTILMLLFCS